MLSLRRPLSSVLWRINTHYISSNSHLLTISINMIHYNIGFKTAIQAHPKLKIVHFSLKFFEHQYLTYFQHLWLKISMRTVDTHSEGRVSQIFNIGPSFCLMTCGKWMFVKNREKSQKLPVFCHKIKSKP